MTTPLPREVLAAWALEGARIRPLGNGLINQTWLVSAPDGERSVLQRVNPLFDPGIHHNIAAVTEHLAGRDINTPRLVPTRSGELWLDHEGAAWRLQTLVPGHSMDALSSPTEARAAGRFVGQWHAALDDLSHEFVGLRSGVHDTPAHLERLEAALSATTEHRLLDAVTPLARDVLRAADGLQPLPPCPQRVCHGDLKINNLMFELDAREPLAVALIDLDTVAPMPLAYELGDAWRSWCNSATEDQPQAQFEVELFAASVQGWREGYGREVEAAELEALLLGPEWISLELAARFAADALFESYFGWDAKRFAGRGEHNLARARGQWSLHEALESSRAQRERVLRSQS